MTHANEELKALTEAVATWAAAPGQHQQEEPNELEIQAEPIKGAEEEEKEERGKEGGKRRRSVTQGGMEKENTRRLSSVWENFKTENDDEPLPCSCSSQGSSPCSPSISSSSSSSSSSNSSSSSASGCAAASVCWCESPGRCSSFLREPPLAVPSCRQSQSENSSPARGCAAGGARRFHFSQCCLCCWDSYCSASSLVFEASCLYTLARCYHHLDIVDWAARLYLAALAALQQAQTIAQTHTADLKLDLPLPLTHNDELQTQTQGIKQSTVVFPRAPTRYYYYYYYYFYYYPYYYSLSTPSVYSSWSYFPNLRPLTNGAKNGLGPPVLVVPGLVQSYGRVSFAFRACGHAEAHISVGSFLIVSMSLRLGTSAARTVCACPTVFPLVCTDLVCLVWVQFRAVRRWTGRAGPPYERDYFFRWMRASYGWYARPTLALLTAPGSF
eukprot:GHVT01005192.1.p1 GENE.GHVT01005192.1~~GHVT01005192.1.p1  ORF type:complete len:442 (-),score=92.00 GHVT01005192.1:577-1902(-)